MINGITYYKALRYILLSYLLGPSADITPAALRSGPVEHG